MINISDLFQGDKAEYFYIILSGSVSVNIAKCDLNTGVEVAQTIDQLKEHDAFGGTAIIHNTVRTASVIAASTYVEVLMLHADIFRQHCAVIFLRIYDLQRNFICTHTVFRGWPEKRIKLILYDVKSKTFRPGKIIDYDLTGSRYIYFVMEGAVDIVYYNCGWLFSRKLQRNIGVLGGNRIFPPNQCNLPKRKTQDRNVRCLLLSTGATVLVLPKSRYLEITPKQLQYQEHVFKDSFKEMSDVEYKVESNRIIKWMEYRDDLVGEVLNDQRSKTKLPSIIPRLIDMDASTKAINTY